MKEQLWTFVATVISILLGWTLNETSQIFRDLGVKRRTRKKVLFVLLETRFLFKQLDTKEVFDVLTESTLKAMPGRDQSEREKLTLRAFYENYIGSMIEDDIAIKIEELEEYYKKVIDEYANIDPFSAFYLKGKNNIVDTFDQLYDYFDELKKDMPQDSDRIDEVSEIAINKIKPELLREAIDDIDLEILAISRKIGFLKYRKAKKYLADNISSINQRKIDLFNSYINELLKTDKLK